MESIKPTERVNTMLVTSQAFKDAFEKAAFEAEMSTNAFLRKAIAEYVKYDLDAEEKPTRKMRRFPSANARKEHYKLKAREDRKLQRQLLDALKEGKITLE